MLIRTVRSVLLIIFVTSLIPHLGYALDAGYERGFYLLSDDKNYKFQFNIRAQPLHEFVSKESSIDENSFTLALLRTYFTGHGISPKYQYFLSVEFSKGAGMNEGYLNLAFTDYFKVIAGRYFIPINREDVFVNTGLQLVDVSIVSDHFGVNEDYGMEIYGSPLDPLTYYLFVANGGGEKAATTGKNQNKDLLVGTRLEYNILGEQFEYQGDPEISKSPNLGIAGTILYDFGADQETQDFEDFRTQQIDPLEPALVRGDIDSGFSWYGFSLIGQWQYAYNTRVRTIDHGLTAQTGFYVVPKRIEIAGRWSSVFPDFPFPALANTGITAPDDEEEGELGTGMPVHEWVTGLNSYFRGHDLKLQIDYSQILNVGGARNINDQRVRTQLTFVF
ncbi:MAG: hypothetical protein HYT76_04795 [Deltaproteobacteria bacterium]|nr:hypothetical protein [Deltaproteobacteria bacterium]